MKLSTSFKLFCSMAPLSLSSGATLPADIAECANANMTYEEGPFCPDFNVTFGKHVYSKTPLSASGENTTMYEEQHDYLIWKSEDKDKEGAGLCFPKSKATYTMTTFPDGNIKATIEGSSPIGLEEKDTVAEGITAISKPGTFYQVEGSRTLMIAPDYSGTVTEADGNFIDVCKLLSSSGEAIAQAPSPASASTCSKCPDSAGGGDPFAVTCACSADKTSIECEMNCSGEIVAGPWIKCNTLSTADVCGDAKCTSEMDMNSPWPDKRPEFCALGNVEGCPDTYDPENKSAAKCLCEGEDKCDSFILKDAESSDASEPSTCDKCPESAGGGDPFAVTCACSADKTSIECDMNCSGEIVAGPWIKCNTLSTADVCGDAMCTSEVEYCALGNVEGCPDKYDSENKDAAKCLCEGEDKCDSFILEDATSAASGSTSTASAVFTFFVAIAYLSL